MSSLVSKNQSALIGIDGIDGAGKTTLANKLAPVLKARHFELDEFLEKEKGAYVSCIRCDHLKAAISRTDGPIIVDGVCLLAVAEQCALQLDAHIYLKRLSDAGLWYDDNICTGERSVTDLIKEDENWRRMAAEWNGNPPDPVHPLFVEIAEYHRDHRPLSAANYIFELSEGVLESWKSAENGN